MELGQDFWTFAGFGYGVGVERSSAPHLPRGVGWDGGYGCTAYWDPRSGTIAMLFTQRMFDGPGLPEHLLDYWRNVAWTRHGDG